MTPTTLAASAGLALASLGTNPTACTVRLDRDYVLEFNLDVIEAVEIETGKSMADINETFVRAKGIAQKVPIGFLRRFVRGALAAVDPTFREREAEALPPGRIHEAAIQMAPAWNAAVELVFNVKPEADKKKGSPPADPSPAESPVASPSSSESPSTPPVE
jgi:hypothetical protein